MESLNPQGSSVTPTSTPPLSQSGHAGLRALALAAVLLFAAGLAAGVFHPCAQLAAVLRWTALCLFLPFAVRRRSLLIWTFFAMLAGAELGVDAPPIAAQTHFLADIFLRLIRMIVAPLIFGGIVTGIAGHNELRGVGRVALKSIIFFEAVTTIGLILGAVAINLTQAGAGVTLPASIPLRPPPAQKAGSRFCSTSSRKTSPKPSRRIRFSRSPSSRCSLASRWPCYPSPSAFRWFPFCNRSPRPCSASPASSWSPRPSPLEPRWLTLSAAWVSPRCCRWPSS
jgi:hypothetical protein